jgi:hypothetical protein
VIDPWAPTGAGVLRLPSGRLVRGRSLRRPLPPGPAPTFAVYLLGRTPPAVAWESRWLRWPDLWLPGEPAHARKVLHEAWESALTQRVEIACRGGRGRTGTALACLAIIDGVPANEAVAFVRRYYDQHAVETPWQKSYLTRFTTPRPRPDQHDVSRTAHAGLPIAGRVFAIASLWRARSRSSISSANNSAISRGCEQVSGSAKPSTQS